MDDIQLPKTRLCVSDGVLRKLGKNDTLIATFALTDIDDIRCEESADYGFPLTLITIFAALGVVAKLYIPSPGWAWTATVLCGGVALFSILIIHGRKIVVVTKNGTVSYPVTDTFEEAEGFAMSVKQRLNNSA